MGSRSLLNLHQHLAMPPIHISSFPLLKWRQVYCRLLLIFISCMNIRRIKKKKIRLQPQDPEEAAQDKLFEISHFADFAEEDESKVLLQDSTLVSKYPTKGKGVKRAKTEIRSYEDIYRRSEIIHTLAENEQARREAVQKQLKMLIYNTLNSKEVFVGRTKCPIRTTNYLLIDNRKQSQSPGMSSGPRGVRKGSPVKRVCPFSKTKQLTFTPLQTDPIKFFMQTTIKQVGNTVKKRRV